MQFCEEKDQYDRNGHFWTAKHLSGFPKHPQSPPTFAPVKGRYQHKPK